MIISILIKMRTMIMTMILIMIIINFSIYQINLLYVEIMNDKKKWKYLSYMNNGHQDCSTTTIENKLFVFGGYNKNDGYLNSNEMYDFNNNNNNQNIKWTNLINM